MAKSNDLKIFLESSLTEIFKATVSDILDSVDRTLSEYQGTIQRIEAENEGLKRLLFAQKSAARGTFVCHLLNNDRVQPHAAADLWFVSRIVGK